MFKLLSSDSSPKSEPKLIWDKCLEIISKEIKPLTYNSWFLPIKPLSLEGDNLTVQLMHKLQWEYIEEHFAEVLKKALTTVLGPAAKLNYIIIEDTNIEPPVHVTPPLRERQENIHSRSQLPPEEYVSGIRDGLEFFNFVKGEGNQLAVAAATAVSDNPGGTSFNPLFIYGGVGLGKTHLLHAIGNGVIKKFPNKKIKYTESQRFASELVELIQQNQKEEFIRLYSRYDVLIIDDIQFLKNLEKTQDYLFHIFNAMHQNGKQIIFASDKAPKDISGINERLISRFHWGLSVDIQPPDFETRVAILYKKAPVFGVHLPAELFEYIATHITSNIRELEGCLTKLKMYQLMDTGIDLELVKRTVREISTNKRQVIGIDLITKIVCESFGVDEKKIRDKTRKADIAIARQVAMYLSKQMTRSSLKMIGLHFGGRDHSTVIHAITTVDNLMTSDPTMKQMVEEIKYKVEIASV